MNDKDELDVTGMWIEEKSAALQRERDRRDMFAAHALQGLIVLDDWASLDDLVDTAWTVADGMIKRSQGR